MRQRLFGKKQRRRYVSHRANTFGTDFLVKLVLPVEQREQARELADCFRCSEQQKAVRAQSVVECRNQLPLQFEPK